MAALPLSQAVSLYMHMPFCPRLCWWCACRAERAAPGRVEDLAEMLARELQIVVESLPQGTTLGRLHFGGGTPVLLGESRLLALAKAAAAALPPSAGCELVLEAAPFDHDPGVESTVAALARHLPVHLVLGLGAPGGPEGTSTTAGEVATIRALRSAGAHAVTVEFLAGLPGDTPEGFVARLSAALAVEPERVVLTPWRHVPARSRRQARSCLAPPDAEVSATITDAAAQRLEMSGYQRLGAGTWVIPGDPLLAAAAAGRLTWGFEGIGARVASALIGLGPSAVSRLPSGMAQNPASYAAWRRSVAAGRLPAWRGLSETSESRLAADMVADLVCRGRLEVDRLIRLHGPHAKALEPAVRRLMETAPEGAIVPLDTATGSAGFVLTRPDLEVAQRCVLALLADADRDTPRPATRGRGAAVL